VCISPAEDSCQTPGTSAECSKLSGTTCVAVNGGDKCLTTCTPTTGCNVSGQACTPVSSTVSACLPSSTDGGGSSGGNDGSTGGDTSSSGGGDASHDTGPAQEAGVLGYVPSNFGNVTIADGGVPEAGEGGTSIIGADGGIDWAGAPAVSVTGTCIDTCLPPPLVVQQGDGSLAHLFVLKSLTVQTSARLTPSDATPVIFAVLGDVQVLGTIDVGANLNAGGCGALSWVGTSGPQGPGGGGNGYTPNYPASGGGGGSFCGLGGKGGATSGAQAVGGAAYPGPSLVPLVAGSAGGWANGYAWGAGGGAIQISSGTSIVVSGVGIINAGGGGGNYGGGGSGGAILLEAPTVTIQGNLTANGGSGAAYSTNGSNVGTNGLTNAQPAPGAKVSGAGYLLGGNGAAGKTINGSDGTNGEAGVDVGGGGGGAGFVRINTSSGSATITGTVSPDPTTPCVTQGTLH
jgi:hypothetical protein